jgi:hypothetical protein
VSTGTSIAVSVAELVLGIAAVKAVIWIPIVVWFRRRTRDAYARLATTIEGETVLCPPEKGNYRGATAPGYPMVNNSAVIALTSRRLVCITVTGKTIEIPLESITSVREAKVFKASAAGGRAHLIIRIPSGEIGFFVSDNDAWIKAIRDRAHE